MTPSKIAKLLNCTTQHVYTQLKQLGLELPSQRERRVRLESIRQLAEQGKSQSEIGRIVGVSQGTVWYCLQHGAQPAVPN